MAGGWFMILISVYCILLNCF